MLCDLRFWFAGRDRWCPPRTRGFRSRTDPARTRVTTITAGSGSLRAPAPAALRSSATGAGIGLPCPVGRFLAWEAWRAGRWSAVAASAFGLRKVRLW